MQTVNRKSGDLRHGDVVSLDTDHRGLNKFRSRHDPNFILFLRSFNKAFDLVRRECTYTNSLNIAMFMCNVSGNLINHFKTAREHSSVTNSCGSD
jgi:hypothetical protein